MQTFGTVLIKVKPGKEKDVKAWLAAKPTSRSCRTEGCKFENIPASTQLDGTGEQLPCEKLTILALAYLPGPFDFAVVTSVDDMTTLQEFITQCIRDGQLAECIMDTQTMTGLLL